MPPLICTAILLDATNSVTNKGFELLALLCDPIRAVASWFVTLIRMHMHAGSNPDWGTVRTGPLASLLTLSFFVLSRQCLKMRVLGVDVET